MSESCYFGLDGGGTRTVAILTDTTGEVLAFGRGGSTNYHTVGEAEAKKNMFFMLNSLLSQAGRTQERLQRVCLGLSGCDRPDDRELISKWMQEFGVLERTLIVNDAVIALAGGALADVGLLVISGTGSIYFARGVDGSTRRIGGWGPLLADEGSGYHLGREALRAIMRAYDGYEPSTRLTELILQALKLERVPQLVRWSTTEGLVKANVAALSRQVFSAAAQNDATALEIVEQLTDLVAQMTTTLTGLIDLGPRYEVVLAGGNFKHSPLYFERAKAKIEKRLPQAKVILPKMQPVVGAILYAMADSGQKVSPTVVEKLRATYPERA